MTTAQEIETLEKRLEWLDYRYEEETRAAGMSSYAWDLLDDIDATRRTIDSFYNDDMRG